MMLSFAAGFFAGWVVFVVGLLALVLVSSLAERLRRRRRIALLASIIGEVSAQQWAREMWESPHLPPSQTDQHTADVDQQVDLEERGL